MSTFLNNTTTNISLDLNLNATTFPPFILGPDFYATLLLMTITIAVGLLAALVNACILIGLFSTRSLRQSSSLLIALTFCHSLNGQMHAANFWPRTPTFDMIFPLDCLNQVWPNIFVTIYQLLPIILALIGLERLLALGAPIWYRVNCSHRRLWMLTGILFVMAVISMVINWMVARFTPSHPIFMSCFSPDIFGNTYMVYGVHMLAIIGGLCANVCSFFAVLVGHRRVKHLTTSSKSEIDRINRQIRLAKCILTISLIDLVCVVIPNIVLLLFNLGYTPYLIMEFPVCASLLFCIDSVLNIVPFLVFNLEFRRAFLRLIRCKKASVGATHTNGQEHTSKQHPNIQRGQKQIHGYGDHCV